MPRKLFPLILLCAALAYAQSGPPPGVTFTQPKPNAPPPPSLPEQPPTDVTDASRSGIPAASAPEPLTTAERTQVVDTIAARLRESYVLPDMAQQLAGSLKAHQQQGDYDNLTNGASLAFRLTADLQSVSRDRHLRVEYSAAKLPPEEGGPSTEEEQQYRLELARTHCGFPRVGILPGNIAYVQVTYFGESSVCGAAAANAMKAVSHADAVIFDLRLNHGGDPAMVSLLASYLFDRPTHLDDLYNRHENKTTEYWATPDRVTDLMPTQPIYVLTSRMSYSGAEQFCYDLRNLKRATIIGEKTGGAAHPTRNRRINDHFLIAMPEYRYINSVTRTDWENQGVAPDIPAAPWNALVLAQKLAMVRLNRSRGPSSMPATAMH